MGLELVECVMTVEEHLDARLDLDEIGQAFHPLIPGGRWDCTAAELLAAINASTHLCVQCGYDLRAHPAPGTCPECGHTFVRERRPLTWDELQQILADAVGWEPGRVQPDTLLARDLQFG